MTPFMATTIEYYRILNSFTADNCPQCHKGYCVACANAYAYLQELDVKRKELKHAV